MAKIGDIKSAEEVGMPKVKGVRLIYQACASCGKTRWVRLNKDGKARSSRCHYCSRQRKAKIKAAHGYVGIKLYPDDPFYSMAARSRANIIGRYILEHRLVMAKHLGRRLQSWEIVHHKNEIKEDNRIENLELLPSMKAHLPSMKLRQRLGELEKRVTLLEAENILLKEERKTSLMEGE